MDKFKDRFFIAVLHKQRNWERFDKKFWFYEQVVKIRQMLLLFRQILVQEHRLVRVNKTHNRKIKQMQILVKN